ncbi:MAG: DNA-deoxyinosine glycosylase, partial [Lachnospiraceae bacterium]|nr:DNA-deoxyinosine glycosylase [Lachnospiraceae bacterium]
LKHGIAIWDGIASCDIVGSSDSSIKNVVPSDLHHVLDQCSIKQIYANGNIAKKLFEKYQKADCGRDIIGLPSTSPANAAFQIERLLESWRVIKQYLI